jgi:type I restriction enzyme R subunit
MEIVRRRYAAWRKQQATAGANFTSEQEAWLDKIAEHIATSLSIEMEDFHDGWFAQRGSLGRAYELFGDTLETVIINMNRALIA